ncbi:unnamed protein product [Schistosoma rodhaini]|uniref:Protein-tyrosine-phosphatase n=1 Tax=Schistosoma rodhaini TaxID=6188 RepID=A0AA85F6A4_9TREM|nr:unnamed protein product [Schistosoma rodhaini]
MVIFNESFRWIFLFCAILYVSMSGLKSFELNDEDIPLHFTSESSYLIVAEGEQVLLPCRTNVFSEALVSWYKDDIRIAENLTFSFRLRSASREDAGYYHCVVKTTYGGIRSQKVKLEIGYLDPPSKIKARSFIEVTLDQAVIIWPGSLDQDKRKQPFQLERRNGLWKSVFNSINETNKALPPSYYLQAVPFPQAIWTINNAPIPSTLNIFVSQLEQAIVLLNIDKEMDSKVIRARLINGYGRANSEIFSQTHIIQVKDPPLNMATNSLDLVLPPKDVSLTLKDDQPGTAVFECVFNARPAHALRVQWFKSTLNGKHEPIDPSNVISSPTKMSTSPNSNNNNNQIIYKFDTSGLNRTLIISNILPSVIPSDYFQQTNQKGIYSEEYTCHAYLNDYNGNSVFDMNKFMLDDSQFTTSVLSSPSSTNSAINLYQRISPISTTARLKLYLPPKVKFPPNLMSSLTSQLEITPKYNKLVIIETSASMIIQLPCELDYVGIPKAEIKWLRNGDPIDTHNQEYYQIHINHTLIIKNLKLTDAGIFQCYSYNDVGEDFLNIWLKVTSFAPRLCNSEIIMENITVLKESTTVLTCPIHGAPTPEYKWYKETNENEWTPIHQLYQKYKNSNYSSTVKRKQYSIKEDDMSVMLADDKLKSTQLPSNSRVPMGLNELEIYNVDYKSTGLYKCEAVNYLGNQSAFIYVSVYSRTIPVHYLPSSITAFANQSLSIMCSFYIDQNTIAEINWFHGRKESTLSGEKYKKHNNTMLLHETTKDNTKVITNYNLVKSVPIDPVITYFSRDIPQKHKPSIRLKEYGSILHVNSVDVIHQGFYVCEILSPGGNYTLKTELKVVSLPTTPTDLSVTNVFETSNYNDNNNNNIHDIGVQLLWRQPQANHQLKITHYAIFIHKLPNQNGLRKQNCEIITDEEWELFSVINLNETIKNPTNDSYIYTIRNISIIFQTGSYCFSLSSVNFLGWSKKSNSVFYSVSNIPKTLNEIILKLHLINVTSTSIHIVWVAALQTNKLSLSLVKEYQLYYWIENSDFVEVKKCPNINSFIQQDELTNLKPSTRYHLKISACNDYECGTFSEVLQVQTLPHELFKTPSLISVTVHQGNKVEISFFSDYIDRDDYYSEEMKGYLVKLSCIDPPGCSDLQMYLPLECVMDTERFVDEHFNVNPENTIGIQRCNELNPLENSIFLYSANVNRSNHQISISLNSLSPYTLYELFVAYVYTNRVGPFSRPAEVFRTIEDVPSRIINLMVNTDGRDGLIVEWNAPEKPNGKILQYILHYTEIKPIDSLIDIHHQYDHIESGYNTTLAFMNQRINQSSSYDDELSIHQYPITHHLSTAYTKDSNFIHSIQTRTYDNRKYAGYYSLNRTTYRVHIKSLIHKHIYQIRMFALNTAGLSPVTLQLGITSLLPKLKYQYQYTEKNFIQWINLIHLNKHQEKIFKWLNSTRIQFVSEPVITKINAHNAEFSIEFNLKLDEDISHSIHYNQSTPVVGDFSRTIKLIEKCKWPIKIQKIPLNGYQALSGNDQIDSWNWRIITAYKYTINSSLKLSLTELTKFNVYQGVQLTLSFKLFNLSSSNYYRIEVWQPIGLLFGNYKQIASKILYHSNLSKWFKIDCKPPTVSPSSVSTYMLNIDQMKITWQPLSSEEWNGIPGGYLITVQEAETEHTHSSITTYPNHDHMYNANETVKIQITQSKCGLDYLQIFINDSMAFSYIIEDLKLGSDYMVSIRAASVEIGNSDKWLLGPQTVIQHLSIYKQAKNNEDIRFLTSMRMSKFIPYNLKVSRELDWIVVSWKENIKVDCGQLPEGYQLIFNKVWFNENTNETLPNDDDDYVNYLKFIPFNDTNLNRSKILQSSDSFYENILKLPLKIFFNPNEACYFNGYLRLRLLYIIGQSINENVEQATVYLNLEAEKIRHRLLLRKVIPLSKQRKARVLITWIPNINNDKPLFPHTDIFTLKWTRIDPISYENLSLPFTRLISWPDTNNHILMNNGYAALKSAEKASKKQKYSEYLITVDELLMEATYLFQLIQTNFSQPINISVNDEKMCSSKTQLLVYVTTVESFQTGPRQRPVTPKIQLSHRSFTQKQYENTICPIAKTHLSWPNYLRQLHSNQTTEYSSGFLYTSPVTNYVLHYAEVMNNNFSEDIYSKNSINFGSVIWKTYQPAPQIDEVNDFLVDGLLPYKMYIFRLAAQTDIGISPFSLPTDILITSPQRPCYYSIKLEFELRSHLHSEISQRSDLTSRRRSEGGCCEYLLLKWKALNYHQWNSQPGWYHITYRLWSSNYNNANTQLFNLFIKHDENQIKNSYFHVELKNLIPNHYYLFSIEAINNYNTNNLMTSVVQLSSSSFIIINSGIGCNPIELQYYQIKQMTRSIIMYMNKLNYPILLSKPLLSPMNFLCLSDPIQVLIKCTWEYKEFQGILGFILEVHEYGDINYNISYDSIQTHSIFIKPHVHGVLLHSVSSITQSSVILSGQTIIKPYFYYKTSIHVITTGGHGPNAYFPQSDYKETKINTNIKLHHSTENGCLSGELLCTSQSPPNPPFSLSSQWLSRDLIKLEWLQPEQLNGKLVNYRITWSEITFPFKDNQFIDRNSINSKELGHQFTVILKSFETTYTIDQLHENTSYIFKVYARTESKQNDGWSIPNCIYASTSYCWFNSPQIIKLISQHKCDFKTILKTIDPSLEKFCSFNSPILRRPVVFISSINKTATNPKFENLTRNSLKFHYNKTNINYASTVITILWSEAMSGINSITHILIELRYSWNLNKWYSFTMINSSMRLYTFDFEDLTKISIDLNKDSKHSFHAMRKKVRSQTTMNEINQEATIRMITAAFTDANVPIDSTTHVAIQFRVSPVNQFQIGLPSQQSDWSVIKLKTIATPFYHHWWFIMMLGLCATSIIFILLITLKWNIHRRQQLNKSTFVTEKSDSNVSSSNAFMNDCCLALKLYHSNYLTKTMNNNIQLNGEICEYPNLINSTFHNTRSPETVELTTGIHYTENSNNMLHKNQNPFNLVLNNHNWDVLYNTSPEILIAQTDSSLGSKAPSNRTVSTSEVERFDDFTQNYNNCITSQGLINSNQSLYPEINVPIIPSYNFSSPYSLQNNQLITDISNSMNNEILLNQNLPSPCNSNKLYIDQISAPYPYSSLQNESIMLNQNNLYKLDTNRTLKFDKSVTPFNQTINSLPSSEYQWNTNHQNGQTHLDQKSYDVELSLTQNHSVYQKFINPINNTSPSNINAFFNLADTILNNHNSNQHFYQMNTNGDNYIMSKSHIGTYEPENSNYMKYNSLQKKSLNRHSMATDYNRSERVKTNMELNSLPMEYSPLNNDNQSSVNHNGQRLIQDFDFNLLPDHLILNGQVNQTSISNTTVNQISNIYPTGSHNNDVNNDTVQVNENSHITNTKHLSKQGSIHQSPSPYKNTDLLYNNYNSTMTIVKNNDQDTLSNWDENLEFHITTDLELLTSTEV